eukprot:5765842-Alexandrium_andersonii.AAC.1
MVEPSAAPAAGWGDAPEAPTVVDVPDDASADGGAANLDSLAVAPTVAADGGVVGNSSDDSSDEPRVPAVGRVEGEPGERATDKYDLFWKTQWGMAAPYDNFAPPMAPDPNGQFVQRDNELGELREAMFRIRNCTDTTS